MKQTSLFITFITLIFPVALYSQSLVHPADSSFGVFTEVSPSDSLFITPPEEDFWVVATSAADYDNDGDLDIAVLGTDVVYNVGAEHRLILMRNDSMAVSGNWEFTYLELELGNLTAGLSDMAWGDADGDGDLDLALASDDNTVIYRNDSGTLVMTNTTLPGYWEDNSQAYFNLHSLSWADYDNDSDLDLLIPSVFDFSTYTYKTFLMRNEGSNGTGGLNFTPIDSIFAPTSHAQSMWADEDGDGDLDLLLVNISPSMDDGFIRLYHNNGNGTFTGSDILDSLKIERGEAQWGDYDGDGDLDILITGHLKEANGMYTPMSLRIYSNNNGTYTPAEVIPDPAGEGWFDFTAATWADYDSDGDVDILLAGNYNSGSQIEGRARIYTNNNNVFTDSGNELPAPHAAGDRAGTFSWLDMDSEGDLDYFIAGEYFVPGGNGLVEAQMHLYRNDVPGQNMAPAPPSGITLQQVSGQSVLFTWQPGVDDHTPVDALTYDLTLFHDNIPVVLPEHSPEPGSVSAALSWTFNGLQQGEHYAWTLGTVDAAYIGSPVATGEFIMGSVSAGNDLNHTPNGYYLGQNYPNPVSQSTTIRYTIPKETWVNISLFNSAGVAVVSLVDAKQPAGTFSVSFEPRGLSDGIYYYRLKTMDFSQSEKLILGQGK